MIYLKVAQAAQRRGFSMARLQREAKMSRSTLRRYWYSSVTGLERDFGTLAHVDLLALRRIAEVLMANTTDLISG